MMTLSRKESSERNQAISENGLLPYQLGSNDSYLGAGISFASFIYSGVKQLLAVTASSSWGEGQDYLESSFLRILDQMMSYRHVLRTADTAKWSLNIPKYYVSSFQTWI